MKILATLAGVLTITICIASMLVILGLRPLPL